MTDNLHELCIQLLGGMPEDSLFEVYEKLIQIRDFYTEASVYVPPERQQVISATIPIVGGRKADPIVIDLDD